MDIRDSASQYAQEVAEREAATQATVANIKAEGNQTVHTFDEFPMQAANGSASAATHAAVYNPGGDAYSINQVPLNAATGPLVGGGTPMLPVDNTNKLGLLILAGLGAAYFLFRKKK